MTESRLGQRRADGRVVRSCRSGHGSCAVLDRGSRERSKALSVGRSRDLDGHQFGNARTAQLGDQLLLAGKHHRLGEVVCVSELPGAVEVPTGCHRKSENHIREHSKGVPRMLRLFELILV